MWSLLMNVNTKTKLMCAVLCAFGVISSDFACATETKQTSFYCGGYECRHPYRQAQGVMTMFGGLVVEAGKIADEAKREEAFKAVYDAMCAYFRLIPGNFNVGNYSNDASYTEYAKQQSKAEFETKIMTMEKLFNIKTDEDRLSFERMGEDNRPIFGASLEHDNIRWSVSFLGRSIAEILKLESKTGNPVDAITEAGDLSIADTPAKKDALMFFRCIRASMSLNNFGYSMITPEGQAFVSFVVNTLK